MPCVSTELSLQHKSICTLQWVVSHIVYPLSMVPLIRFKEKRNGDVFSIEQEIDFNMDVSVAHTVMDPVIALEQAYDNYTLTPE